MNQIFSVFCSLPLMLIGFTFAGCTSDPYAPINQTTPIRQMDNAFDPSGSRYYQGTAPSAPRYYQGPAPSSPYSRGDYDSPSYSRY